jgi:hypothetical protein
MYKIFSKIHILIHYLLTSHTPKALQNTTVASTTTRTKKKSFGNAATTLQLNITYVLFMHLGFSFPFLLLERKFLSLHNDQLLRIPGSSRNKPHLCLLQEENILIFLSQNDKKQPKR